MTLVWIGDKFSRAPNRGPCALCGKPVIHVHPWWTTHPSKDEAKPLHEDCAMKWFAIGGSVGVLVDTKPAKE